MTGPHYNLHGDGATPSSCEHCGKPIAPHLNYCDWDCHVAAAKAAGARVHTPNGLPIRCVSAAGGGLLLEHQHGDHPDYRFPVDVIWIGPEDHDDFTGIDGDGQTVPLPPEVVAAMKHETHALIYTDGAFALTIHDTQYALWNCEGGRCAGGHHRAPNQWRITNASCDEIRRRTRSDADLLRPPFRLSLDIATPPHNLSLTVEPDGHDREDDWAQEHGHADHRDCQFSVRVEWIGPGDQPLFRWRGERRPATSIEGGVVREHALLYADRNVAVTLRRGQYAVWSLRTGTCVAGWDPKHWRLTDAARQAIRERIPGARRTEGHVQ